MTFVHTMLLYCCAVVSSLYPVSGLYKVSRN
ncbi:DUF1378 family protein [Escherichia coli]